jgi:pyrroline-5-carboxylate reductase
MPNTPCLIGHGASAYACDQSATTNDRQSVESILTAVGTADQVKESLFDAVTGLSGSGPAYVFTFIEALTDAGVNEGLPRPLAAKLATQTVIGAAKLVVESGNHPAVLRDQVTSPGGTTIAGLNAMDKSGLRSAIHAGVHAATQRSRELEKNSPSSPQKHSALINTSPKLFPLTNNCPTPLKILKTWCFFY